MEHYASTLATTAAAVFGLVAAAQILHPGNFETPARPPRAVVAAAPAPAWIDPPARLAGAETAPVRAAMPREETVQVADREAVPAPRVTAALPEAAAARPLPAEMAPERGRKAATHRRRSAARGTHLRQAALDHPAPARVEAAAPARDPDRIDPIGDLIRGLGLGRDG